jgi:hypothetical protein
MHTLSEEVKAAKAGTCAAETLELLYKGFGTKMEGLRGSSS